MAMEKPHILEMATYEKKLAGVFLKKVTYLNISKILPRMIYHILQWRLQPASAPHGNALQVIANGSVMKVR